MAGHTLIRIVVLACAILAGGCAGWSTWDDERTVIVVPDRSIGPGDYMVVRGDTMYSIAFRHQLDFRQLARWNNVGSDYLIYPGQVLRLKPSGPAAPRERMVTGEIESVGMDDVAIGKPQLATVDSPPPAAPPAPEEPAQTAVGGYQWSWPTAAPIGRRFGQEGNRGLDFYGRDGQPVLAAAPGRVVYSGNALKGYGELIIIKHDELFLSAYGYNARRNVKEGDIVTAGQPIAVMGRGPENKPLLHFEIRRSGKPVNPSTLLPAQTASAQR